MGALDVLLRPSFSGTRSFISKLPSKRPFLTLNKGSLGRARYLFISNGSYSGLPVRSNIPLPLPSRQINSLSDGRFWHPEGANRPLAAFDRAASRIVVPGERTVYPNPRPRKVFDTLAEKYYTLGKFQPTPVLAFNRPSRLLICLRRQMRREVMNALGFAGKTGFRPPYFNHYSRIKC